MTDDLDELFRSASCGDEGSLDELVARYLPRLHAYVRVHMGPGMRRREASVDLVQSVCREVLEDREQFEFRGEGPFLSWLLTAALNKLRERARFQGRQRRDVNREREMPADAVYAGLSPSHDLMDREGVERLEQALDQLPDDYREVIVLARLIGLSHQDVAEHIGRTVTATRKVLGRALAQLGRLLQRQD